MHDNCKNPENIYAHLPAFIMSLLTLSPLAFWLSMRLLVRLTEQEPTVPVPTPRQSLTGYNHPVSFIRTFINFNEIFQKLNFSMLSQGASRKSTIRRGRAVAPSLKECLLNADSRNCCGTPRKSTSLL